MATPLGPRPCAPFARYDELAFAGGLSNALSRLFVGDPQTLEAAVIYLETHPRFFRSQYNTKKIIQLVKKHPLRPDLQGRFQHVIAMAHARKIARRKAQGLL
jgi:hypothetical protein